MQKLALFAFLLPTLALGQPASLDPTFGDAGIVHSNYFGDQYESMAVQPDGKIVVVGEPIEALSYDPVLVRRYNSDGTVDSGFGANGAIESGLLGNHGVTMTTDVELALDGKIVVTGCVDSKMIIARFSEDGVLDPTFGTGGIVWYEPPDSLASYGCALGIDSNGRILVLGLNNVEWFYLRYHDNGAIDTSFGIEGVVNSLPLDIAVPSVNQCGLVVFADGSSICAGGTGGNDSEAALMKLDPNGNLDTGFGTGGLVTTNLGPNADIFHSLAVDASGTIVVVGCSYISLDIWDEHGRSAIVKYTAEGVLDPSFGSQGICSLTVQEGYGKLLQDVKYGASGEIISVGSIFGNFGINTLLVQCTAQGVLDECFGIGGELSTSIDTHSHGQAIAIQSDNKVLVAGASTISGQFWADGRGVLTRYVECSVGLPENATPNASLTVAPNPVSNTARIDWTRASHATPEVRLFDPAGRSVLVQKLGGSDLSGSRSAYLDCALLPPGMYVVELRAAEVIMRTQLVKE